MTCQTRLVSAALLVISGSHVVTLPAQTISGTVTSQSSGLPMPHVSVLLLDKDDNVLRGVVSDSTGSYLLPTTEPGFYKLRADAPGYAVLITNEYQLGVDEALVIQLMLSEESVTTLEPVEVTGRRELYVPFAWEGFERRRRRGWGLFITRSDIEQRNPTSLTSLLQGLPGVRVVGVGGRRRIVRMVRAAPSIGEGQRCSIQYYLDGWKFKPGVIGIDEILPSDVEAIEIYRSASETPAEYLDSNSRCGVIAIWSRR